MRAVLVTLMLMMASAFASATEPLRVGVDPNLKPFAYMEASGELAGFDVDVAKEICVRVNRPCQFVQSDWDGLIPSLQAKKVDILITAMSITPAREKVVDFSVPYYRSPSQLLSRKGVQVAESVGVLRGSVDEVFARYKFLGVNIVAYANQNEALMDLANGRLDSVLGPRLELEAGFTEEQAKAFHFTGPLYDDPDIFGPGIGMAVREGDPLLAQVNMAIKDMRLDGKWQKLANRYFDVDIWAY